MGLDKDFNQKWERRKNEADVYMQSAMNSIDEDAQIDRTVDLSLQLPKTFKKKLANASGFLANHIFEQSYEIGQNIKALNYV